MLEHPGSVGILCRNTNERLVYYVGTPRSGWYIMSEHLGAIVYYYQGVKILFQLISNRR